MGPFLWCWPGLLRKVGPVEDVSLGIYYRDVAFCDSEGWLKVDGRLLSASAWELEVCRAGCGKERA